MIILSKRTFGGWIFGEGSGVRDSPFRLLLRVDVGGGIGDEEGNCRWKVGRLETLEAFGKGP